ncbi:hypothetical protein A1Q1_03494 [Trichosporon asahii var. asahii CBS 2479]|uniref:Uncharacterized protein n=1 Tax=Trichosporon asahii var. asahii (strain ATCC 90039 / CBS 2479 / JCM 2466 / KCTC 7840 / NBRC 103889/ NCYC 2677 / UAMH 7654) TaxID=1186058 RepID=J6EXZ9_TRIAS|nr:hypothetical protein A1Q1_03494 [Trichosporon asahii var. asahii CBS 2479]EJT47717.1 hypothetical protein A1Q1_03494 [Trichosporon asahii var. asahii CBS 2479]
MQVPNANPMMPMHTGVPGQGMPVPQPGMPGMAGQMSGQMPGGMPGPVPTGGMPAGGMGAGMPGSYPGHSGYAGYGYGGYGGYGGGYGGYGGYGGGMGAGMGGYQPNLDYTFDPTWDNYKIFETQNHTRFAGGYEKSLFEELLDRIPSLFRSRAASFTEAQAAYNRIYNLGVVTRSARDIGAAAAFWALILSFEQVLELTSSVWEANRATFGHNLPIEAWKNSATSRASSSQDAAEYAAATVTKLFEEYGSSPFGGYGYDRRGAYPRRYSSEYEESIRRDEREEAYRRDERDRDREREYDARIRHEYRDIDRERDQLYRERAALEAERMYGAAYRPDMMMGAAAGAYGYAGPYVYPIGLGGATAGPGYGNVPMPPSPYGYGYNQAYYDQIYTHRGTSHRSNMATGTTAIEIVTERDLCRGRPRAMWTGVGLPYGLWNILTNIGFQFVKIWNAAKQEQEAAQADYDMQREARMREREQMEMQREQARGERLRRREIRREYRRRRRNFYSMSDDEVNYGTQRRPRSRALARLTHLGFRSDRPKVYVSGAPASMATDAPQRATSASPGGAAPNLAHLPQVTRVASAEVYSSQHLHPNSAYQNGAAVENTSTGASTGATTPSTSGRTTSQSKQSQQTQQRTGTGTPGTDIPDDYGSAQFAKEERWRAREQRRRQKEEARERRDAAYDQRHYGSKVYNPYAAAAQ